MEMAYAEEPRKNAKLMKKSDLAFLVQWSRKSKTLNAKRTLMTRPFCIYGYEIKKLEGDWLLFNGIDLVKLPTITKMSFLCLLPVAEFFFDSKRSNVWKTRDVLRICQCWQDGTIIMFGR